jgi:uncharacterized delta-60 repeat protein
MRIPVSTRAKKNCKHIIYDSKNFLTSSEKFSAIAKSILFFTLLFITTKTNAQAGSLDVGFGNGGKVSTSLSATGHSYAYASAIQTDGKILAAGYAYFGNNIDFALARFNTDGSLDLSFDGDGKVTTDLGDSLNFCNAIAIQSDGKIVLAGLNFNSIAVVRYNANGSLDSTFDMDGIVTASVGTVSDHAYAITVQNDGKIVVAAHSFSGANFNFSVIRLNNNGSLDASFGNAGKVITDIYGDDFAYAMALQTDGKIVVAGASNNEFAVVRYNTDGSLDSSFDTDGKVRTAIGGLGEDIPTSLAIQSDGKIVLAGYSKMSPSSNQTLVRYNTNGSLDLSFDTDGIVHTPLPISGIAQGVKVQNDGKIITVSSLDITSTHDFAVLRYKANGSLDSTFDTDGVATTDLGFNSDDRAHSALIQNDGKIVVVGFGYNPSYQNFMIVRYNSDNASSINNSLFDWDYKFYPNPTTDVLHIKAQVSDFNFKIIDNKGRVVLAQNCTTQSTSVDVHHLPSGPYYLKLQSGATTHSSKFEKK